MKEFAGRIAVVTGGGEAPMRSMTLGRRSPERTYDVDFFEQFTREVGWRLPT